VSSAANKYFEALVEKYEKAPIAPPSLTKQPKMKIAQLIKEKQEQLAEERARDGHDHTKKKKKHRDSDPRASGSNSRESKMARKLEAEKRRKRLFSKPAAPIPTIEKIIALAAAKKNEVVVPAPTDKK
jgi:hypothetical protein